MGGAKCDLCEPFHFNLTSSGCEPCGECEQSLRDDLEREAERLRLVTEMAEFLRRLSEADMQGLGEVERLRREMEEVVMATAEYLGQVGGQVAGVNASYVMLEEIVRDAEQRVSAGRGREGRGRGGGEGREGGRGGEGGGGEAVEDEFVFT